MSMTERRLRVAERSRRHLRDDLVYSARAEQTAHTIRAVP